MMKILEFSLSRIILLFLIVPTTTIQSQVSIGSTDPPVSSAVLELKPENSDLGLLLPRVQLESVFDDQTIKNPATGLWVFNTTDSDPDRVTESDRVKKNKFYYWNTNRWYELTSNESITTNIENVLSEMGIAKPAIFILDGTARVYESSLEELRGVKDLLMNVPINTDVDLPLKEIANFSNEKIKMERQANSNTSKITIEPGIYQFTFVYEFVPTDSSAPPYTPEACVFSPYFMDFPTGTNDNSGKPLLTRINSNCIHDGQEYSNHGNTIDYVVEIKERTEWTVKFGLGDAKRDYEQGSSSPYTCVMNDLGQTVGIRGFIMPNVSTFLYILALGDN